MATLPDPIGAQILENIWELMVTVPLLELCRTWLMTWTSLSLLRVNLGCLGMHIEGLLTAGEQSFRPDHRHSVTALRICSEAVEGQVSTTHFAVRALGLDLALIRAGHSCSNVWLLIGYLEKNSSKGMCR
jgi:hypothetical protein